MDGVVKNITASRSQNLSREIKRWKEDIWEDCKMGIKETYKVMPIKKEETYDWLLNKHYAKRIPNIERAFGLYNESTLLGICTFGTPPKSMNNGESIFNEYRVKTFELNRLVMMEGLAKNTLSFFVSQCLGCLPTPCCIVSYADFTFGHNGYIYQATNWLYIGLNQIHEREWFINGKEIHPRTLSSMGLTSAKKKIEYGLTCGEYTKKHRYLMLLGNSKEKKEMRADLLYKVIPYPKGDNQRYDASYKPQIQGVLFT
ncbi:MAG: hypothetical protein ACE5D4_08530 [Thermodesulfobacteriota bacterium]